MRAPRKPARCRRISFVTPRATALPESQKPAAAHRHPSGDGRQQRGASPARLSRSRGLPGAPMPQVPGGRRGGAAAQPEEWSLAPSVRWCRRPRREGPVRRVRSEGLLRRARTAGRRRAGGGREAPAVTEGRGRRRPGIARGSRSGAATQHPVSSPAPGAAAGASEPRAAPRRSQGNTRRCARPLLRSPRGLLSPSNGSKNKPANSGPRRRDLFSPP